MDLINFAQKNGAEDVAVEIIDESMRQIRFANNSISIVANWLRRRYDIFVAVRRATAAASIYDENELENAVAALIKSAKLSKPSTEYRGLAKGPFRHKKIENLYDKRVEDSDGVDIVHGAINAAQQHAKNTAGVLYLGSIDRSVQTSEGADASEKLSSIKLSIRAFNDREESGHYVATSRMLSDLDYESAGKKAGGIAKLAKNPVQGKTGHYDVIFDQLSAATLVYHVADFSTAFAVDSGFSFLADKLGKKIAGAAVNITDSGIMPGAPGSSCFDSEGVPTQETSIIENGILKTYLHNTSSAVKYNTKTTGNAGIIAQHPHNIVFGAGKKNVTELFSQVKKGIYITNVWYTRFQNFYTGDFSTIPRDGIFLVENGEIKNSIKNIRVTDNMLRLFHNVADMSKDRAWMTWWDEIPRPVYTPCILIKDVNITLPTM
jgi:PmbA protein